MTYEYGPWTEYTGEDLGDAMVQVQVRYLSRMDAEKTEPVKASEWGLDPYGIYTIRAYRKVVEPRVVTIIIHRRDGKSYFSMVGAPTEESFALTIPETQYGKLDFSRQPTWRKME